MTIGRVDAPDWFDLMVWDAPPPEDFRAALSDWFGRHGIDSNTVPLVSGFVARHCLPRLPGITYTRFAMPLRRSSAMVFEGPSFVGVNVRASLQGINEVGGIETETAWFPMEADPLPFPPGVSPVRLEGLVR